MAECLQSELAPQPLFLTRETDLGLRMGCMPHYSPKAQGSFSRLREPERLGLLAYDCLPVWSRSLRTPGAVAVTSGPGCQ